jgi:regulator of sigma E protease
MDNLITIGQFILSLSILIILHECGHFFPAKWFKTRVEKFYLFFDPYFSLFKYKKGETEYGIGWLPFGGYVKISGMVDESFDIEALKEPPKDYEFRAKPAWQRLIIMLGGVTVNFILGILLFAFILFHWGEQFFPTKGVKYGMAVEELGSQLGLEDGDLVVRVGDFNMEKFDDGLVSKEIIINEATALTVLRNGEEIELPIDPEIAQQLSSYENRNKSLFTFRIPNIVREVAPESNAAKAGLRKNDQIIGIDGLETPYFNDFAKNLNSKPNQEVTLALIREADTLDLSVMTNADGMIGYITQGLDNYIDVEYKKYPLGAALAGGFTKSYTFIGDQIKAFGQIFRGKIKAKDSLGSFISIGGMFGTKWNWQRFWTLTAMLSILLGFINLLPIPALDGGHVMFLLFEAATGIKPSDRVLEYATMGGFVLLIALMVYALGLDIMRLF